MTPEQVRAMIWDGVRYPMVYRIAARLHLAKVTKPQFQAGVGTHLRMTRFGEMSKEVWAALREIRTGQYKIDDRLRQLAEEIGLPPE